MIKRVDAVADSGEDLTRHGRASGMEGRTARQAADRIGDTANEIGKHLRDAVDSVRDTRTKVRKLVDMAHEASGR
jgi:methyl-accepting chemotaxis protein